MAEILVLTPRQTMDHQKANIEGIGNYLGANKAINTYQT
jgi:hypothetical protein